MGPLGWWLFAALVIVSVIDVGARIVNVRANANPSHVSSSEPSTSGSSESRSNSQEDDIESLSYDLRAIRRALGVVNPDIQFLDVFARILTAMKKKDLDAENARKFIERLSLVAIQNTYWPHTEIFVSIVKCFGALQDNSGRNQQTAGVLVKRELDSLLSKYANGNQAVYVISQRIAPSLTNLLMDRNNNEADLSREVATVLLTDSAVEQKVGELFYLADLTTGPTHRFVMSAFQQANME